jgi:hypothetical protein
MSSETDNPYANEAVRLCCEFLDGWPAAEWGPAHIVLSDFNLEDEWIAGAKRKTAVASIPEDERAATLAILDRLAGIPEAERLAGLD